MNDRLINASDKKEKKRIWSPFLDPTKIWRIFIANILKYLNLDIGISREKEKRREEKEPFKCVLHARFRKALLKTEIEKLKHRFYCVGYMQNGC